MYTAHRMQTTSRAKAIPKATMDHCSCVDSTMQGGGGGGEGGGKAAAVPSASLPLMVVILNRCCCCRSMEMSRLGTVALVSPGNKVTAA
jgi:hypothetical protein